MKHKVKRMPLTLSRLGQIKGTGSDSALFLTQAAGEILSAFNLVNQFLPRQMVRTISTGKSATFPVVGTTAAKFHVPGEGTHENAGAFQHNEQVINIDDLLYANVIVDNLDELKNHYDVRSEYTKQLGESLAKANDTRSAIQIARAARQAALVSGQNGGTILKAGATVGTAASVMVATLFAAQAALDEKGVPEKDRFAAISPSMYYAIIQATDALNKDWGGQGSYAEGTVRMVGGLELVKTANVPSTNIAAATSGERNTYTGDFSKTKALVWQKGAVGTVKLMDLNVQTTGEDFKAMYQGDMILARQAQGTGILQPACAVEITNEAA